MSHSSDNAVTRELNVIRFRRLDHPGCTWALLSHIYQGIKAGFLDFSLDFRGVDSSYPNVCAPIASIIDYYTSEGIEFKCLYTSNSYLERTCLCGPASSDDSKRLAAGAMDRVWIFTATSIGNVVNSLVRELARSVECKAGVLQSVEWSVYEIMDNVIQHSGRDHGYIMGVVHQKAKHVAFCIADSGQGILNSFKGSIHTPRNSLDAITLAIKEGVTRDTAIGQGNGLWGLHRVVAQNKGKLAISSASATWIFEGEVATTRDRLPFLSREHGGAIVDFQLDTNQPISIEEALRDKRSESQKVTSLYMDKFDTFTDFMHYPLKEHSAGTGTRASALRIRNEIVNILNSNKRPILLDFDSVAVISSSFADELIGKLLVHLGFVGFNQMIHLRSMNSTVQAIVQRSVNQRILEELTGSAATERDAVAKSGSNK